MKVVSITVAMLFLLSSVAFAVDAKVHPGAMCAPLVNSQNHYAFVEGFVAITTGGTDEATCPIVRDNTGNTNGLSELQMQVLTSGSTICNAHAISATGSVLISVARSRSTNGPLNWSNTINTSSARGSYAIRCDMPAWAQIATYYADEF